MTKLGVRRVAVVLLVAIATASIGSTAAVAGKKRSSESWLYVVDAQSATVLGRRITFFDVDPLAVGFTDRPKRGVARFEVSELVDRWQALGFVKDPPNVAISWLDDAGEHTVIVELSEPSAAPSELGFTFRVLEKGSKRLDAKTGRAQPDLPGELLDVVLFIDHASNPSTAFPTSVNDQITD